MKQAEYGIRRWVWQGRVTFPRAGGQGHGEPEEATGVVCSKDAGQGRGQEKPRKTPESGAGVGTVPWPRKEMEPQILRLELKHKGSLLWTPPKPSSRISTERAGGSHAQN